MGLCHWPRQAAWGREEKRITLLQDDNSCNEEEEECFTEAGVSCGDTTNNDCTDPDTCDGQGSCQSNHEAVGSACEFDGDFMTVDACDGNGSCEGRALYCDTYKCWTVPPTGQNTCFDNSSSIGCPTFPCDSSGGPDFCGQDAHYPDDPRTLTASTVSGDIIVTDSLDAPSGLIWQADWQEEYSWQQALDYCASLDFADQTDWRLPDVHELLSLVNYGKHTAASDFPGMTSDSFWTSLPNIYYPDERSYDVDFRVGDLLHIYTTDPLSVRCVRGGPNGIPDSEFRFYRTGTSGSETVFDRATQLEWQDDLPHFYDDCTLGEPASSLCNWQEALAYCQLLDLAGHDDWRLPNVHELLSLLNVERYYPASDFPGMPFDSDAWTWSSTPGAKVPGGAWIVIFTGGNMGAYDKTAGYKVRCVRGGP